MPNSVNLLELGNLLFFNMLLGFLRRRVSRKSLVLDSELQFWNKGFSKMQHLRTIDRILGLKMRQG